MKSLLIAKLAIGVMLCSACTTCNSDAALIKTSMQPANCSAPVNGACASHEIGEAAVVPTIQGRPVPLRVAG